ncbi:MAG: hypothetical protein PHU85_19995 [Phycisphaerae bacterium]|nr:hypothetical protein [Phycisphaerae bacterium]
MADLDTQIVLETRTCPHGHIYAVPSWTAPAYYDCPMCAAEMHRQNTITVDDQSDEINHLHRVIRALRGALNRKRAKK